jgi:hypothetical protein
MASLDLTAQRLRTCLSLICRWRRQEDLNS